MNNDAIWSNWVYINLYVDAVAPNPPGISPSTTVWTNGNVSVGMSHGWDGGIGVNRTEYALAGATSLGWTTYVGTIWIVNEGQTVIYGRTIDNLGNVSGTSSVSVWIDKSAPAAPGIYPNTTAWTNGNVTATIANGSDGISGVNRYEYALGGATSLGWSAYGGTITISNQGQTVIYARSVDNAGNYSGNSQVTVSIDKSGPSTPVINPSTTNWTSGNVTATITGGSDAISGTLRTEYMLSGSTNQGWATYTGTLTITNEGQTTISSRSMDNTGNYSATSAVTVKIDKAAPSVPLVISGTTAWTSSNVTVTVNPGPDGNSGVNRTEYGLSGATTQGWTSYTGALTISNEGTTTISARTIDNAGNVSTTAASVANIDKVAPSIPSINPSTTNWSASDVGFTVTHGADLLSGVKLSQYKLNLGSWNTYSAPVTVSSEGVTNVAAQTIDNANNVSATNTVPVKLDFTGPTAPGIDLSNASWSNTDVIVTIGNGTDAASGVQKTQYMLNASGSWVDYSGGFVISPEGTTTIDARSLDNVNNVGVVSTATAYVDKTSATAPDINLSTTDWSNSDVTLTITPGLDSGSGVQVTQYKVGSGSWVTYTGQVTISTDGQTIISARTVDNAGNTSTIRTAAAKVDKTPPAAPIITTSNAGWSNVDVVFSLTDGGDTNSGVQKSQYKIGAAGSWTDYSGSVTINTEGTTTIYARTIDNAGNISSTANSTVYVDKTAPTAATITLDRNGWTTQDVTVMISSGTDAGGSGVNKTQYKLDAAGAWTDYSGPFVVATENTEIYGQTLDNAGNVSPFVMAIAMIDKTKPTAPSMASTNTAWTNQNVTVTLTDGTDATSGILKSQYRVGLSSVWTDYSVPLVISNEGITDIYARTMDKALNLSDETTTTVKVDKTPPTEATITLSQSVWTNQDVSFTVGGSIDTNAITYEYKINSGSYQTGTSGVITANGLTTITAHAIDSVGNVGNEIVATSYIDKEAPTITITPNQMDWQTSDITATIHYDDPVSGIKAAKRMYKITNSATSPGSWDPAASNVQAVTISAEGEWYIHAKVEDNAGNSVATTSDYLRLQHIPLTPTNLTAYNIGETQGSMTWDLPSGGVLTTGLKYQVTNVTTGITWTVNYPANSITDTALTGGKTYQYQVKASNLVGQSAATSPLFVLTLPKAPTNVNVQKVGTNYSTANVSFDPMESATQYHVVVKAGSSVAFDQTVTSTVYQPITSLAAGTNYTVLVSAINATGEGPTANIAFLSLPDTPGNFNMITVGENNIKTGWNSVVSATYYNLHRDYLKVYGGPALGFNDSGLLSGTMHSYQLNAGNGTGVGTYSHLNNIITLPSAVPNLDVTNPTTSSLNVGWGAVRGAANYLLKVDGSIVNTVTNATYAYTVTGLTYGTNYNIEVYATNGSGQGTSSFATGLTLPAEPTGLTATSVEETTAVLTWQPVSGATKYRVVINGVSQVVTGTTLNVTGLSGSQAYTYTVEAGNTSGLGPVSQSNMLTKPKAPTHVAQSANSETSVVLSWDADPTAVSYTVLQQSVGVIGASSTNQFTVNGLLSGTEYKFFVRTTNATGDSTDAAFDWITKPSAPDHIVIAPGAYQVSLSWDEVRGANRYIVTNGTTQLYNGTNVTTNVYGLTDGSNYNYEFYVLNANDVASDHSLISFKTKPKKPVLISAPEVTTTAIRLDFSQSQVTGADTYSIERDGSVIATIPASATNYQDAGLTAGTNYRYKIQAWNVSGPSPAYTLSTQTLTDPVKASSVVITRQTNSASVMWDAVYGASNYVIKKPDGLIMYRGMDSSVDLNLLESGTNYAYTLFAENTNTLLSTGISLNVLTHPKPPVLIKVNQVTETTVFLGLDSTGVVGADQYTIEREGTEIARVAAATITFKDTGLQPGTVYNYVVKSVNASGVSDTGFAFTALTLPGVSSVIVPDPQPTQTSSSITWDAVPGATGYKVYIGDTLVDLVTSPQIMLTDLKTGATYNNVIIIAVNGSGEGKPIQAPSLTTLPSDTYTTQVVATKDSLELTQTKTGDDIYVISVGGVEVYRGSNPSYTVTGLQPDADIVVTIWTENATGDKSMPKTITAHTLAPNSLRPLNVKISHTDKTSAQVSWDANANANLYWVTLSGSEVYRGIITQANLMGLSPGTSYTVAVYAKDDTEQSLPTTASFITEMDPPVNFYTPSVGVDEVTVSFDPVEGASEYQYSTDGGKTFTTVPNGQTGITLSALTPDTDYTVIVKATNGNGSSQVSTYIVHTLPKDGALYVKKLQADQVTVEWDENPNYTDTTITEQTVKP